MITVWQSAFRGFWYFQCGGRRGRSTAFRFLRLLICLHPILSSPIFSSPPTGPGISRSFSSASGSHARASDALFVIFIFIPANNRAHLYRECELWWRWGLSRSGMTRLSAYFSLNFRVVWNEPLSSPITSSCIVRFPACWSFSHWSIPIFPSTDGSSPLFIRWFCSIFSFIFPVKKTSIYRLGSQPIVLWVVRWFLNIPWNAAFYFARKCSLISRGRSPLRVLARPAVIFVWDCRSWALVGRFLWWRLFSHFGFGIFLIITTAIPFFRGPTTTPACIFRQLLLFILSIPSTAHSHWSITVIARWVYCLNWFESYPPFSPRWRFERSQRGRAGCVHRGAWWSGYSPLYGATAWTRRWPIRKIWGCGCSTRAWRSRSDLYPWLSAIFQFTLCKPPSAPRLSSNLSISQSISKSSAIGPSRLKGNARPLPADEQRPYRLKIQWYFWGVVCRMGERCLRSWWVRVRCLDYRACSSVKNYYLLVDPVIQNHIIIYASKSCHTSSACCHCIFFKDFFFGGRIGAVYNEMRKTSYCVFEDWKDRLRATISCLHQREWHL